MKGQAFVTLPQEKQGVRAVNDTNTFVLKGKPIVVVGLSSIFICAAILQLVLYSFH